jgi:hypothetical protein
MVPTGGSSGSRRCTEENQQVDNKNFNLVHVKRSMLWIAG